ncbi:uncharacterized protein LOC135687660 [Rhopilema esculentum]|uniref:uncharacterized protein LOC135687660 n=1 Tax=Rhopilema esculentum TaxID=499914 RepID=UPI0031D2A7D5
MTPAVLKESFLKGVRQASLIAQTSFFEAFNSVLNHFGPKMIHFSHAGMYCRHAWASIFFNFNILCDVRRNKDGTGQVNKTYPKFKNGEATVRSTCVVPNYGTSVEELVRQTDVSRCHIFNI